MCHELSLSHFRSVEMSKPGASTATPVTYQFAQRPKELSFLEFVFNQETGEILGRTPVSWCKWRMVTRESFISLMTFQFKSPCFTLCTTVS